jgi:hypothetical protein
MEERSVANILIEAIRVILRRQDIGPHTVHMCGVALHALQRLPLVTEDVGFTLNLTHRHENGNLEGLGLRIENDCVELETFGSEYTEGVGSDSYSNQLLRAAVGGREDSTDFIGLEEWADWFRQCAATYAIDFEDFSDSTPNWFDDTDPERYWDQLDSDLV